MGKAYEIITGRALNPGAGPAALGANTGDTFQVKATPDNANGVLESLWASTATAGLVRLRSPRLHDVTQGIRFTTTANGRHVLTPDEFETPLYSQDILIFEIGGGAAETDAAAMAIYYPDLGGADARLASWNQVKSMVAEMTTVEVSVTGSVTAGDWSPGTAINATNDLLKANQDYAILGYTSNVDCLAVGLRGPDTANLRVGGPGTSEVLDTRSWFIRQEASTGRPHIPIINQANRAATQLFTCHTTAATTIIVDLVVARLTGRI